MVYFADVPFQHIYFLLSSMLLCQGLCNQR